MPPKSGLRVPERKLPDSPAVLTAREADVYECAANGLSNAEIATALFISESTVKTHMRSILAKLDLKSRSRLVARAWDGATSIVPTPLEMPVPVGNARKRAVAVLASSALLAVAAGTLMVAAPWVPTAASSPPLVRAVSGLAVLPFIADVEPIDQMPTREGVPMSRYLDEGPGPDPVVADVAYLGSRDLYYGIGLLSTAGRVCLNLVVINPEINPNVSSRQVCTDFAEFTHTGLMIDMGAWEVRWRADGTVTWT